MAVRWREISRKPLGLRVHDGGELLGDPRKLAGVGDHHAEKPEVFRVRVELQNDARDQTKHLLDIALGFNTGRKCRSSCPDTLRSISRKISSLLANWSQSVRLATPAATASSSMLTDPNPCSRNRREAASTMASRDLPRGTFGTIPFEFFRSSIAKSPSCTNRCKLNTPRYVMQVPAAVPQRTLPAGRTGRYFGVRAEGGTNVHVLICCSAPDRGDRHLLQRNGAADPGSPPVRTVTVHEGAEGEIVSLTGQVRHLEPRLDALSIWY